MFEIVVLIIIGWAVYRKVKSKQEDDGVKGNNSLPNTTVTTYNPKKMLGISDEEDLKKFTKPTAHANKSVNKAIQAVKEDGNSTTAYLKEKAEADQREHAREKYEEQKRLYETRGGLAPAERYLDGETIPQGKRCVICGYCGAENLIATVPKAKYSCYFCREPL